MNNKIKNIILAQEPQPYPIVNIISLPAPLLNITCPNYSNVTPLTTASVPRIIIETRDNTSVHKRKRKLSKLPDELDKLFKEDIALFKTMAWKKLVAHRRPRDDFSNLDIAHPARRLMKQYKNTGVPVITKDAPWSRERISEALARGLHNSYHEYEDFLREEFTETHHKQQWMVLPFDFVEDLPSLRLTPQVWFRSGIGVRVSFEITLSQTSMQTQSLLHRWKLCNLVTS